MKKITELFVSLLLTGSIIIAQQLIPTEIQDKNDLHNYNTHSVDISRAFETTVECIMKTLCPEHIKSKSRTNHFSFTGGDLTVSTWVIYFGIIYISGLASIGYLASFVITEVV